MINPYLIPTLLIGAQLINITLIYISDKSITSIWIFTAIMGSIIIISLLSDYYAQRKGVELYILHISVAKKNSRIIKYLVIFSVLFIASLEITILDQNLLTVSLPSLLFLIARYIKIESKFKEDNN